MDLPPKLTEALEGLDPARRWHVLHTKSRQEKALAETLDQLGIMCFLPLGRHKRHYANRVLQVDIPLFPGYVFLHGTLDEAYDADRTKRVANIIAVVDQLRLRQELWQIATALGRQARLDPYPELVKGILVEVTSGPLKGLRGLVDGRTNQNRLILQVSVLGQAASVEIDGALLEPVRELAA